MKQLGLGFAQYTQDYDERLPIVKGASLGWDTAIAPYSGVQVILNTATAPLIFQCPSDSTTRNPPYNYGARRSYSVPLQGNSGGIATSTDSITYIGRNIAAIPDVAQTLLLAEQPTNNNVFANNSGAITMSPANQVKMSGATPPPDLAAPLHLEGWNYLFCDGHVKWLRPQATIGPNGTMTAPQGMWSISPND